MEHGKAKNGIRFNSVITPALKHLTFFFFFFPQEKYYFNLDQSLFFYEKKGNFKE